MTTSASAVVALVALWALWRQHQRRALTTLLLSTKMTSPGSGKMLPVDPRSVKSSAPCRDRRQIRYRHGLQPLGGGLLLGPIVVEQLRRAGSVGQPGRVNDTGTDRWIPLGDCVGVGEHGNEPPVFVCVARPLRALVERRSMRGIRAHHNACVLAVSIYAAEHGATRPLFMGGVAPAGATGGSPAILVLLEDHLALPVLLGVNLTVRVSLGEHVLG